jgi:hypothetical protein
MLYREKTHGDCEGARTSCCSPAAFCFYGVMRLAVRGPGHAGTRPAARSMVRDVLCWRADAVVVVVAEGSRGSARLAGEGPNASDMDRTKATQSLRPETGLNW